MTTPSSSSRTPNYTMKIAGQNALAISAKRALEQARQNVDTPGMAMASGNRATFERLVQEHLEPATQLALRLTGEVNTAEDLVQETMLKAIRSWETFQGNSTFKTWLFRILINSHRDRLKRPRRTREQNSSDVESSPDPIPSKGESVTASAEARELNEVVTQLIGQLPDRQRETLVLSTYHGMSHTEIAETLGITAANVHSNLSIARKKLKQQLAPYLES